MRTKSGYVVYGMMRVYCMNEHHEEYCRIDGIPPTVLYDGVWWEVVV